MPLRSGSDQATIGYNIHEMMASGHPHNQAVAAALHNAHYDDGGMVPSAPDPTPGLQPSAQSQTPQSQSLIQRFSAMSPEQLRELAPRLSGQVQQIVQRILQQKQMAGGASQQPSQPQFGIPQQAAVGGSVPVASHYGVMFPGGAVGYASGGAATHSEDECVPILAAGGEFTINPYHVKIIGDGDIREGHRRLDEWVPHARKQIMKVMGGLKGPVRG